MLQNFGTLIRLDITQKWYSMENFKNIIRNTGMSTRPECYSGRGATTSDLNSDILFSIHKDIKKEYGKVAAESFVRMVAGLKVASATTFLNELYRLFNNGWKFRENPHQDKMGIEISKNEDGEYDGIMGMLGVVNAMNQGHDSTSHIVGAFLHANGVKPKKTIVGIWGSSVHS